MANAEHLELLRQGVDLWNEWRRKNPSVVPDLSEEFSWSDFSDTTTHRRADLKRAALFEVNLRGADLRGADLQEADAVRADFRAANLHGALLNKAYLPEANFAGADLTWADFGQATVIRANFSEANLSAAKLIDANLGGAKLSRANLQGAFLRGANFREANLSEANLHKALFNEADLGFANLAGANLKEGVLSEANLHMANLHMANLGRAHLVSARLTSANLRGADLSLADLHGANLNRADLSRADLRGADLSEALLVETKLANAVLNGCRIYGISAWNVMLSEGTKQRDLVITAPRESAVTVDDLEVAQFVYLLLRNDKIRRVIDTVGKKGVLLLGRFTEGRIAVLDRLRDELRKRGYLPIVFNFDKPETKDFTETVRLLAGLSKFVIADITNPKSAPLELQATVPEIMVPFRPIIEEGEKPFAMLQDLWSKHRDWVFEPIYYSSVDALIASLDEKIIRPAEARFVELLKRKAETMGGDHV
jgi:uncharacterized protein YjbI with pentapeptide repeats